mmetsp:Transcript_16217/g.32290  ORF Transcript_16217/g.32290 Transcript_16217/m.32290 type:complete len:373 (+) Transcript_16217:55-1173(+)
MEARVAALEREVRALRQEVQHLSSRAAAPSPPAAPPAPCATASPAVPSPAAASPPGVPPPAAAPSSAGASPAPFASFASALAAVQPSPVLPPLPVEASFMSASAAPRTPAAVPSSPAVPSAPFAGDVETALGHIESAGGVTGYSWSSNYRRLVAYYDKHGTSKVPQSHPLGNWVKNKRQFQHLLSKEKRLCLDAVGFSWGQKRAVKPEPAASKKRGRPRNPETTKGERAAARPRRGDTSDGPPKERHTPTRGERAAARSKCSPKECSDGTPTAGKRAAARPRTTQVDAGSSEGDNSPSVSTSEAADGARTGTAEGARAVGGHQRGEGDEESDDGDDSPLSSLAYIAFTTLHKLRVTRSAGTSVPNPHCPPNP